jgi:hypothetical protein
VRRTRLLHTEPSSLRPPPPPPPPTPLLSSSGFRRTNHQVFSLRRSSLFSFLVSLSEQRVCTSLFLSESHHLSLYLSKIFSFHNLLLKPMVKYGVRSPKFIWAPVYSCTHWLRPRNLPPLPPHLGSYKRALLVSQDRRHLFVTPCLKLST